MRSRKTRKRTRNQADTQVSPASETHPSQAAAFPARPVSSRQAGAWILLVPGALLLAAGVLLTTMGARGTGLPPALAQAGPFAALAGLVFLGLAPLMGSLRRNARKLAELEEATEFLKEQDKAIRTSLADLNSIDVAAKLAQVASGMAPSEIKEALTRADEKISNLTKATRMFSQPLEELSKAVAQVSERLEKAEASLQEVLATSQTSAARLEEFAASLPTRTAAQAEELLAPRIEQALSRALEEAGGEWSGKTASLGEEWAQWKQGFETFREHLEERLASLAGKVDQLPREGGEGLAEQLQGLESRLSGLLEEKTSPIHGRVEALQAGLEEIRRELDKEAHPRAGSEAGEDPAVSQVLQILQGLERKVQDLTAGIPQGAPAQAPQPVQAQAGPAASSGEAPPPPRAHSSHGSPAKGGRSVLSAIQKLKQMRGTR